MPHQGRMIFLTIFICTLFLKSTVIDSINPVTSYNDGILRLRRNANLEEESGESISSLSDDSASDEEVETRMKKIKNVNKNKNVIVHLGHPRHHHQDEKQEVKKSQRDLDVILLKLETAHILRDNVISIMGYILQLPSGQLTKDQYASLEVIYNALRKRTIYMYNVLPSLRKMRRKRNSYKLALLLNRLVPNLPPHLVGSGKFLVKQIISEELEVDNTLLLAEESFDVMADISDEMIELCSSKNPKDESKAYDKGSKIIEELLGPVYVKIFQEISQEISGEFPQLLFGIILLDLPNTNGDPIFEEYIRYIAEETQHNRIPNWNSHGRNLKFRDPYTLLINLVDKICQDEEVSLKLKRALLYVRDQFKSDSVEKKSVENLMTKDGLNLDYLISSTIPQGSDIKIEKLKVQFQNYLSNDENLARDFVEKGRFAYSTSRELLLALLARSQMRVSEHTEIQRVTSALLANVVLTESSLHETLSDDAGSLWITIDAVDELNGTKVSEMSENVIHELSKNLSRWDIIKSIIAPQKSECIVHPSECISRTLKKLMLMLTRENAKSKLLLTLGQLIKSIHTERESEVSCAQSSSNSAERHHHHHRHHHRHKLTKSATTEVPAIVEQTIAEITKNTLPPITSAEIETTLQSADTSILSLLPESIYPTACTLVVIPSRGPPSVQSTKPEVGDLAEDGIILPSIIDLHETPSNETYVLNNCSKRFDEKIAKPLVEIYGENYIGKIVGRYNWRGRFPTRLALIMTLLRKATWDAKVQQRTELMSEIKKTLLAVEFLGSFVFLPLISHMENFETPVVWVTFANFTEDLRYEDLNRSMVVITSDAPGAFETGTISTMPLVNPKAWIRPVPSGDAFPGLLPELPKNTTYEIALRPVVEIFKSSTISSLLGEDVEPQHYPNTGALFVLTLQRLREVEKIQTDKVLLTLIENYLNVIIPTGMYIKVPADYIASSVHESRGSLIVDLLGLMKALPKPNSSAEPNVWNSMKDLLSKINLLDELGIPPPPLVTTRGEFLSAIIKTALKMTKIADNDGIREALYFYKDKVLQDGAGAENIDWIKIEKVVVNSPADSPDVDDDDVPIKKEEGQDSVLEEILNLLKRKHLETGTKEHIRRLLEAHMLEKQQYP